MQKRGWEVYIIETQSGKLYTGITNNLENRFLEHKEGRQGARYFNFSPPEHIVFREEHKDRSSATKREIEIKKMSRKQKLLLIQESKL